MLCKSCFIIILPNLILGYGDMAVSNAIGSNVFDILVCLGLPWFLQTAVFNPGSTVKVYSKGKSNLINIIDIKLNFK